MVVFFLFYPGFRCKQIEIEAKSLFAQTYSFFCGRGETFFVAYGYVDAE